MDMQQAVNCAIESCCVAVCLVLTLYLFMDHRGRSRTSMCFFGMVLSCALMGISDIINDVYTGVPGGFATVMLWVGSVAYFITSSFLMLSYTAYLLAYVETKGTVPHGAILQVSWGLALAVCAFSLLAPVTGWVFYIGQDQVYRRGPAFIILAALGYSIYVVGAYILIRFRRSLSIRAKCFFWAFSIIPLLAQSVQNLFAGILVVTPAVTMSLLLVFVFIQFEVKLENEKQRVAIHDAEVEHQARQQALQSDLTEQTIVALSNAVEAKDRYTNGHSRRVAEYAREIVRRLGRGEEDQLKIYYAGLLHDVGKIRVPDGIINKTDKLTPDEFDEIRLHTMAGYYILKEISSISAFAVAARWHHERYDGKGYPNGLSGENIPEIARIIGVADTYDAMTSNRSYRNIMTQQEARAENAAGMGTQFDPRFAQIMLDMIDEDTDYRMRQPDRPATRTILAIDDDPMTLSLLEGTLGDALGYKVLTVSNGRRALDVLRKKPVDLVILDVELPELDGFEIITRIRRERPGLPVIFMTGDRELPVIRRAEAMGASDYLTKPITHRMLFESVQSVLLGNWNR